MKALSWYFWVHTEGPSDAPDWIFESDQVGARFGESVASAGDVDGDGYDDLIIGAPYLDHSESMPNFGGAFLYLGSPPGPGPSYDTRSTVWKRTTCFGHSVDQLGISTGMVIADVLVGAYRYGQNGSFNQPDEGAVFSLYRWRFRDCQQPPAGRHLAVKQKPGSVSLWTPLGYQRRWRSGHHRRRARLPL